MALPPLSRDVHSAETLVSGLSFLMRQASAGDVTGLELMELQKALDVSRATPVKPEPADGRHGALVPVKTEAADHCVLAPTTPTPALKQQMEVMKSVIMKQQAALEEPKKLPKPSSPGKSSPSSTPAPGAEKGAASRGAKRARSPESKDSDDEEYEYPKVLTAAALDRNEKLKVRRICTPKPCSGHLEVPENIFEMFNDAAKGRTTLYQMWAKSGGVKAVFMESVTVLCVTTRKKKLTVKGGFYSREDMKTELGYSAARIEKIVKWAESKGLIRQPGRQCEYDEDVLEYWVNIRTEGTLSKEDMESLTHEKKYEGTGGDELNFTPRVQLDGFDFGADDPMVHRGEPSKVSAVLTEHLNATLKAKNSLGSFLDKMKAVAAGDKDCDATIRKLQDMRTQFESVYEEMADIKAEGQINGFSEMTSECHELFKKATKLQQLSKMRKKVASAFESAFCALRSMEFVIGLVFAALSEAVLRQVSGLTLGSEVDDYIGENVYALVRKYGKGVWAPQTGREYGILARAPCPFQCPAQTQEQGKPDLDVRVIAEDSTAGRILWHCLDTVRAIQKENGGQQLCVFKIGLTANPTKRRDSYRQQHFKNFIIIHQTYRSDFLGMLEMLQAAVIAEFYDSGCRCRNRQLGGESMRDRNQVPRFPPPYYAYCVPAKDIVLDARTASKTDSCRVLASIARVKESSADAPLFKIFRKYVLALPAPISLKKVATLEQYPYLDPKPFLETLSGNGYFHKVLGVPVQSAETCLLSFWEKFRAVHPNHGILSQYLPLGHLIPYYLHGDGGRGYKKDPIEILSMFPALGAGSRSNRVDLSGKRKADDLTLGINLRGNSGTTRFLFAVLSSLVYKRHPGALDALLDLWGQKLQSLLSDGFQAMGTTWYIAVIGFTGDSPFVKKIGHMTRSFHNVRKRAASRTKTDQIGCCWLCMAGTETATENYPFEHIGFFEPLWLQTRRQNNQVPWQGNGGPLLPYMQLDPDDTPSAWFKADLFHVFHAGVGQDFTASAITYSMRILFNLGGFDRDLAALNQLLATFMTSQKKRLHCGFLTKDLLGYSSTREFPEGKWSKNSDTAVVMQFLVFFLQQEGFAGKVRSDPILDEILQAALAMGQAIRKSFKADYWMSSDDCIEIIKSLGIGRIL
ncbi:unnamed protein product [Symbiodinium sp. CCMP2456]|nr:unnamed protein product [Symbiodinium sp. CCMP2456]